MAGGLAPHAHQPLAVATLPAWKVLALMMLNSSRTSGFRVRCGLNQTVLPDQQATRTL
jgi:hypothetical protein